MTKWYTDCLSVYDMPFNRVPRSVTDRVKAKIRQADSNPPLVTVAVIAHNEEDRILSCLWSLCNNKQDFPIEILVINNCSTDRTEEILKELGVTYFNEPRKGPGFARQCGLGHAKGTYHLCIDADTLYPPHYICSMTHALQQEGVVCAYALWSFLPGGGCSETGFVLYEKIRDVYLYVQNLKRPELNVRGMTLAFHTELARREGFRTDIIRGEDGSMALALKKYGKLKFVTSYKARVLTGQGTIAADGSLFDSFKKRAAKGIRQAGSLWYSRHVYEDDDSNLIK